MTTQKVTITLPEEQIADARRAVADKRAASVSAYVSEALASHARESVIEQVLAAMIAEGGEPSAEDDAWARAALGLDRAGTDTA
jgi:antitoxin ParD1/3/4